MRNHAEEFSRNGINEDEGYEDNKKCGKNRSYNNREDDFRGSDKESEDDYYRDSLIKVEDQVETSKLVLQLVTDSRFNMTQINGQRKLGGPPPGWKGPAPGPGCEVFVGKIPRTLYEHEIYPIFRRMGEVYEIRLMMDFSGTNRGYCFVMFGKPEFAQRAINELDNFEIRPGRRIGVVASINNCRLYVGQLPHGVTSENVIRKIYDITDDVGQVSVYRNANDQARYALISYKTHRGAAMARRRLVPDRASLFTGAEVSIDWAHPSMFPSNVVEDTGICDDHGSIEISRVVVGSENKRSQNRRRVRDDFLDHSIRAYLQTDRALELNLPRNKQTASLNQSFNNSLGGITRGINSFQIFDQNSNSRGQNYHQRNNSRSEKNRCRIEVPRKSMRDSNSSFDLNVGSGSSESSGCSSQSSLSERHHNLSKELSDPSSSSLCSSRIFGPLDNEGEIFFEQGKIGGKIFDNRFNDEGFQKFGEKDPKSLNLFDDYTFSVSARQPVENGGDFNEVENNADDFSSIIFEKNSVGDQNFESGKICKDLDVGREEKNGGENDRKSRERRMDKSTKYNSKSQNFEDLESFQKNDFFKASNSAIFSNSSHPQNRNGICSILWNKNSKNSTTAARLVAENCLMEQQQLCKNNGNRSTVHHNSDKIENSFNSRDLSHNINSNAKRAWISSQFALNGYDISSNGLENHNSVNNNSIVYSDSESSGFIPHVNSQVMNFSPHGQNFPNFTQNGSYQNKKNSFGKNVPKNGRPILSRSYLCNEN